MVAPGVWQDEGPAHGYHHRGTMAAGLTYQGSFVVGVSAKEVELRGHRAYKAATRIKRELDPRPNMARCGAPLPQVGEPCARFLGHRDSHRSQFSLDNAAAQRRTTR